MKRRLFGIEAIEEAEKWPGATLWICEDEKHLPRPSEDTDEWMDKNEITDNECSPELARKCISDGADPIWFSLSGVPDNLDEGKRVVMNAYLETWQEYGECDFGIYEVAESVNPEIADLIARDLVSDGELETVTSDKELGHNIYTFPKTVQFDLNERSGICLECAKHIEFIFNRYSSNDHRIFHKICLKNMVTLLNTACID